MQVRGLLLRGLILKLDDVGGDDAPFAANALLSVLRSAMKKMIAVEA